jgi:hypothetical protein
MPTLSPAVLDPGGTPRGGASMRWKLACTVCALFGFVGLAMADTFGAIITKVDGGKVTFYKFKFNAEEKKIEKGEKMTLPTATDVKVSSGKFNFQEKKLEAEKPLENGLKNKRFTDIPEKGMFASITTSTDNKKITEIIVGGGFKKKKKDD